MSKSLTSWFSNLAFKSFLILVTALTLLVIVGCALCVADHYLHFSCRRDVTERVFNALYHIRYVFFLCAILIVYKIAD